MKFLLYQNSSDRQYYFQLLDKTDELLLSGRAYGNRETCTNAIRAMLEVLDDRKNFDTIVENGQYYAVLRDTGSSELARSAAFPFGQGAGDLINRIVATAATVQDYPVTVTLPGADDTATAVPFQRAEQIPIEELYDFTQLSQSGKPGFEPFQSSKNELHYFHFNDEGGRAILYSRGFPSTSRRNARIRAVISNAGESGRYETFQEGGSYYFILKARNGQEIARSRMLDSAGQVETATAFLQNRAQRYAEEYIKKKRSRETSNQYDLSHTSTSGKAGFEEFQSDKDKNFYFHFNAQNGKAMLFSQAYGSAKNRDNGLRSVIRNAGNSARYEQQEENGRHFFVLRAGNRQQIARSAYYNSAEDLALAMAFLQGATPGYAVAYGVDIRRAQPQPESFTLRVERDPSETVDEVGLAAGTVGAAAFAGILDITEDLDDDSDTDITESETAEQAAAAPFVMEPETAEDFIEAEIISEPDPEPSTSFDVAPPVAAATTAAAYGSGTAGHAPQSDSQDDEKGGWPWWLWLLLLFLLLLLLLFLSRSCGSDDTTTSQSLDPAPAISQPALVDDSDNAADEVDDSAGGTAAPGLSGDDGAGGDGSGIAAGDDDAGRQGGIAAGDDETTGDGDDKPSTTGTANTGQPQDIAKPSALPAVTGATNRSYEAGGTGPDGDDLRLRRDGMEWNLANFLSNPAYDTPARFVVDQIRFKHNSALMNMGAYPQINRLIDILEAYPKVHLDIYGHIAGNETDNYTGKHGDGKLTLAEVRARCLYKKLAQRGIDASRLRFQGFADKNPIASNNTRSGQQENRRVEIVVVQR